MDAPPASDMAPFRVALVAMPWQPFNRPSIQLGALKSYLVQAGQEIAVSCLHPYLGLAARIGTESYQAISSQVWLGEGLYGGLLFPEQRQALAGLERGVRSGRVPVELETLWQEVEEATRSWLTGQDWDRYDLVGFSVCFNQLLASLYAARELKRLRPDLPVVFGGSSCVAAMGSSLLASFPWVDYVVHGEGEQPLLALCKELAGRGSGLPDQVLHRDGNQGGEDGLAGLQMAKLDPLPMPDYDDYFAELAAVFGGAPFVPEIPVEFSRGCWWGRCVFCNLNLQWRGYRGKTAMRMRDEVLHLSRRHGCLDFSFTDNVLPKGEAERFFTVMAGQGKDLRFFAEVRVGQRGESLRAFRRGGLVRVQAGIEALSQGLLDRMVKGATVIENIALMKECLELGIRLDGNLITEFPGSTEEEVAATMAALDVVLPYTPLTTAAFFLGHGSAVAKNPERYGIAGFAPHAGNQRLFPPAVLAGLHLLINDYRGDRTRQRRLWKPVVGKVRAWQRFHAARGGAAHLQPALSMRDGGDFLLIRQERPDGPALHHRLRGTSRLIYLACGDVVEMESLGGQFAQVGRDKLNSFLDELVAKRLFFRQGPRCLALAVRSKDGA